jgi:hypothetical protein
MRHLPLIVILSTTGLCAAAVLPLGEATTAPATQPAPTTAPAGAPDITDQSSAAVFALERPPFGPDKQPHTKLDELRACRTEVARRLYVLQSVAENFRQTHHIAGEGQGTGTLAQQLADLDAALLDAEQQTEHARSALDRAKKEAAAGMLPASPQDQAMVLQDPQVLAAEAERRTLVAWHEILSDDPPASDAPLKTLDVRIATCDRQINDLRARVAARIQQASRQHAQECYAAAYAREQLIRNVRNDALLQARDTDHWQVEYATHVARAEAMQAAEFDLDEQIMRLNLSKYGPLHAPLPPSAAAGPRLRELQAIDHDLSQIVGIVQQTDDNFRMAHDIPGTPEGLQRLPRALAQLDGAILTSACKTQQAAITLDRAKKLEKETGTPPADMQAQIDNDPAVADLQAGQRTLERDRAVLLAQHDAADATVKACEARLTAGAKQLDALRQQTAEHLRKGMLDHAQHCLEAAQADEQALRSRREELLMQAKDLDRWLGEFATRTRWRQRLQQILTEVDHEILQVELSRYAP